MGVFNKTFVSCDTCGTEWCIDETGECGLPPSELLPNGWKSDKDGIICPACVRDKNNDEILNSLRELHDATVILDTNSKYREVMQVFVKAHALLKRYGK